MCVCVFVASMAVPTVQLISTKVLLLLNNAYKGKWLSIMLYVWQTSGATYICKLFADWRERANARAHGGATGSLEAFLLPGGKAICHDTRRIRRKTALQDDCSCSCIYIHTVTTQDFLVPCYTTLHGRQGYHGLHNGLCLMVQCRQTGMFALQFNLGRPRRIHLHLKGHP